MKFRKLTAVIVSALTACIMLTANVSAVLNATGESYSGLEFTSASWKKSVTVAESKPLENIYALKFTVKVTDNEAYEKDLADGFYADAPETASLPFQGHIALGAAEWMDFGYSDLNEKEWDGKNAEIKNLGDGTYTITGYFDNRTVTLPAWNTIIAINEWGNKSTLYSMDVISAEAIAADGSIIMALNGKGEYTVAPAVTEESEEVVTEAEVVEDPVEEVVTEAQTEAETEEVVTEAETEEVITEAETEEAVTEEVTEAVTEETAAVTEAPETVEETETTTTAAPETESGAETTAAATVSDSTATTGASTTDLAARDSSLIIVAIAAAVIVVVVVIVFIVLSKKK